MTTDEVFVRYSDVGITLRLAYEDKAQIGRSRQTPDTRCPLASGGPCPGAGCGAGAGTAPNGVSLARSARIAGHRRPSGHEQGRSPGSHRGTGAGAVASGVARRPHRTRFWHPLVDAQTGAAADRAAIRGEIQRSSRLAAARPIGILQPKARATGVGT